MIEFMKAISWEIVWLVAVITGGIVVWRITNAAKSGGTREQEKRYSLEKEKEEHRHSETMAKMQIADVQVLEDKRKEYQGNGD